jgi:hypothetical protein
MAMIWWFIAGLALAQSGGSHSNGGGHIGSSNEPCWVQGAKAGAAHSYIDQSGRCIIIPKVKEAQ